MNLTFGEKKVLCGDYKRKEKIAMLAVTDIALSWLE